MRLIGAIQVDERMVRREGWVCIMTFLVSAILNLRITLRISGKSASELIANDHTMSCKAPT